jgi:hypothetical protein
MAFVLKRWSRSSVSDNTGQESVGGVLFNGPAMFTYASADDTAATIEGANYFADVVFDLAVNDLIFAWGSDAFTAVAVAAVDREAGTITVTSVGLNDSIATANINNNAVTSAKLDVNLVQHVRVSMSLAEFVGMYTTSHEIVAAPGAGLKLILHRCSLGIDYGGTVLAGGGALHVQYDSTANGAGTKASGTLAAATAIAATADTTFGFSPVDTTLVDSTTLNKSLCLAMATADFTGGTGSTYEVDVWYSTIDLS